VFAIALAIAHERGLLDVSAPPSYVMLTTVFWRF